MKKKNGHVYHVNPVPAFSMMVANGGKGAKRRKKQRNPAKAKRATAGIYVLRKPTKRNPTNSRSEVRSPTSTKTATRAHTSGNVTVTGGAGKGSTTVTIRKNPMKKRRRNAPVSSPLSVRSATLRRSVGARKWHHKRGTFVYNPATKKRRRRKAKQATPFFLSRNIMSKKTRRRGKRRSRNPISRRGSRRRSGARRRNPARRSGRRRSYSRNPLPVVRELFGPDMLSFAAGVVVANIGTTMIMNKLTMGTNGVRSFDLPGVDYRMLGTATADTFYSKNAWALALYKVAIGGTAGYLLRTQSPRLAKGIMVGAVATGISDVLRNTGVLNAGGTISALGMGRNYLTPQRGTGFVPGVSPQLSNPAQAFLGFNNVRRPRGMGARVGPGTMRAMEGQVEGAFKGAN